MGKVNKFKFEVSGNKAVFYPGQWVCGVCLLVLNDTLKIKSFTVRLVGEACYRVKKGGQVKKREAVTPVQVQHIYGAATVSAGEHSNDFRFQIPPKALPTSFESDYGFIRYYLEGLIERPWKDNISTRKVFTVWEYVDCNNPLLSAPQLGQSEKLENGGCFSAPKRNNITIQLDRHGYCPGENIIVGVKTEDFPPGIILRLMLTMVSMFAEGSGKQNQSKREILKSCDIGTTRDKTHRFNNVSLLIPAVPPTIRWRGSTGLGISVYYLVELKMFKNSGSKKKKMFWHVNVPVTMATIPLNPNNANQSRAPLHATLSTPASESALEEPPSYADSAPSAPPMPESFPECPPSYEECILGSSSVQDEPSTPDNLYGDSSFTPVYTMARGARMDYSFAQ